MTLPVFLSLDDVVKIHHRMIDEFGGDPSLRDAGLLESAISMPSAQFDGEFLHGNVPTMAAAYLFHICRNHAFVDGNKRTALASEEVFLLLNDYELTASNDALEELTMGVADGSISKEQVVTFFLSHTSVSKPGK